MLISSINKRRLVLIAFLVLLLLVVYWLSSHSRIQITLPSTPASGDTTYTLREVSSGKVKQVKSGATSVSMIISRGNYEVSINNTSGNYVTYTPETPRFLGSQKVNAKLKKELERKFIGDAPKACYGYTGKVLVSGDCGSPLNEYLVHKPATADITTYAGAGPNKIFAQNPTLLAIDTRLYAVAKVIKPGADVDSTSGDIYSYELLRFNSAFKIDAQNTINALSGTTNYTFKQSQGTGIVAYDSNLAKIYNFNTEGKLIDQASPDKPEGKNLKPVAVSFKDSKTYAVLYSSPIAEPGKQPSSELAVTMGGSARHIMLEGKSYSDAKLCGSDKVCLLGGEVGMDVYGINGSSAKYAYSVPDASAIEASASQKELVVAAKDGIISLDVDNREGNYIFMFGDYKFNGIQVTGNCYVLQLTNNKSRGVALLLDLGKEVSAPIDKKIAELQKLSQVSFASVYGNYIYVSANLGSLQYNSSQNGFGYNPETKKAAADSINKEIDRIGIDRKKYVITSNAF